MRDYFPCSPSGQKTETQRYGYVPDRQTGDLVRQPWAIACTISGSRGPFEMTRTVTYGEWQMDPGEDQVLRRQADAGVVAAEAVES